MEEKLDMSQRCALTAQKAKHTLDCFKRQLSSRSREVVPFSTRYGPVGADPEESQKAIRGMEHHLHEERLREFVFFSLEKRKLLRDLTAAF